MASYGFIPEVVGHNITPDLQSYFRYNHSSSPFGSHIPDLNLEQTFVGGFSKLETNADSTNHFDQVFR